MIPARTLAVVLTLALVPLLAACGKDEQPAQKNESYQSVNAQLAETEGVYLDIEGLKYQVQVSRQLNEFLPEDVDYLSGLSATDRTLAKDEEWFMILLRAENPGDGVDPKSDDDDDTPLPNAIDFQIKDTQENVYRPMRLGPENTWAWRPATVRPDELYPLTNSPAGERPPYGAELLFKLKRPSIDNRPLELVITGRKGQVGIVNLDV
jgi:hypothetical protein